MRFEINGNQIYAATGGRQHQEGKPWIVFIHGSGFNHLVWIQQTRALAYDGWNVLAPDLPGHHLSAGEPVFGAEAMAAWMLEAMDAAGCGKAVLCGHSMGGLVALELARRAPERVEAAIFVATASAIPVNELLMNLARNDEESAFGAMVAWAYGAHAHNHENSWPGSSQIYAGLDIMRLNRQGALLTDLSTCASYSTGVESARAASIPTLCVFSKLDRMTPVKGGFTLADALYDNQTILLANCGHAIPTESPRELNSAIRKFLAARFKG